jgi:hypothetical protein
MAVANIKQVLLKVRHRLLGVFRSKKAAPERYRGFKITFNPTCSNRVITGAYGELTIDFFDVHK